MLKLKLISEFSVVCRKAGRLTPLAFILVSTWLPCAHAQQVSIGVNQNPACPGTTILVWVTADNNGEDGDDLAVSGCTITNTDWETYAYGYFIMPDQGEVVISAYDHQGGYSLTVANSANIPVATNVSCTPGTIISNGVITPTNFVICAAGSGMGFSPGHDGTLVGTGTVATNITDACGNLISSNGISVPYTPGQMYFTWMSNGVLFTNIPPIFTNAGSYSFEGWVNYTPSTNRRACATTITVDVGSLTVCVYSVSSNCTPGSVGLSNTSPATNFTLCACGSLSATTNATNAVLTFTTNCPGSTGLNGTLTSNLPPTILSNWWTVSGPGTYTNHGSGLSTATLDPTNGGTGTATFYVSYTTWKNATPMCGTNVYTNSLSVQFNVLQLTVTNLAFGGGGLHTVCQDANAQPYPSPQWTTTTNYPVCYTAGSAMTVMPVFSVIPTNFPLPVWVQGISTGPLLSGY
jgi:hypothetical protein